MKYMSILLSLLISSFAFAADEYPELMMQPSMSERLKLEAKEERGVGWKFQLPVTISAVSTLAAGIAMSSSVDKTKDTEETSPTIGMVVGGGWLALNMYFAFKHRGYLEAYRDIYKLPAKTPAEKLAKERLAEEEINSLGYIATRLRYLSVATNAAANIFMLTKAKSKSSGSMISAAALLASFGPLLFKNRWEVVAEQQKLYKKKVYRPIFNTGMIFNTTTEKIAPGAMVTMLF